MRNWILLSPAGADGGSGQGNGSGDTVTQSGMDEGSGGVNETIQGAGGGEGDVGGDQTNTGEGLFEGGEGGDGQQGGDQGQQGAGDGQQQAGQQAAAAAAPSGQLSAEAIAELAKGIGQSIAQSQQGQQRQQQQQQSTQMDEATFNKTFNVYNPTPDVLAGLRSEDPNVQMKAFLVMRDGMIKQAMTMAEYRRQETFDKLMTEHITPVSEYVRSEQDQRARDTFWKANPELKKFEAIVDATATKLISTGAHQGKSSADFHKLISAESRKVLQSAGINLTPKGQQSNGGNGNGNGQRQNAGNGQPIRRNNMSTLTGGGQQTGGGNRGAGSPKGPPGIGVFDD